MEIIGLQIDVAWENKPANFEKVRRFLRESPIEKGALVVLPEMFATGFSMNAEAIAEPYGGETEHFLAQLAKQHGIYLIGGAAVRGRQGRPRKQALAFGPDGELIGFYANKRPFIAGGASEHYVAGAAALVFRW